MVLEAGNSASDSLVFYRLLKICILLPAVDGRFNSVRQRTETKEINPLTFLFSFSIFHSLGSGTHALQDNMNIT